MAAIFAFATCSYCKGQLFDEALAAEERQAMLGACAHRFCRFCSATWLSRDSLCPLCQSLIPFRRAFFSNASHVVEILCSSLSELTNRINAISELHPILPPPTLDLFSEALFSNTEGNQGDTPLYHHSTTTTEAPQHSLQPNSSSYGIVSSFVDRSRPSSDHFTQVSPPIRAKRAHISPNDQNTKIDSLAQYGAVPFGTPAKMTATPAKKRSRPAKSAEEAQAKPSEEKTPVKPLTMSKPGSSSNNPAKALLENLRAQYNQ